MKKYLLLSLLLVACHLLFAQRPYNVVFDITSKDTIDHKNVVRWLNEIKSDHPDAKLEVVFYGKSLDMVTNGKSIVAEQVSKLSAQKDVSFKVCQIAMKNNNVDKSQLLPGIQTVPDGIYEIISKQGDGWGYIKVAH
jgi:intracellular sulfur oxidation DsrE/DsrF family protein